MQSQPSFFDIVIVGGGMVGATLALALAKTSYKIALIEAVAPQQKTQPSFDDRCLALSKGSVNILQGLDLWDKLQPSATPIRKILVCDQGHFGFHRISAEKLNQPFLGQVITSRRCGETFWQALKQPSNLSLFCPAKIVGLTQYDPYCEVRIEQETDTFLSADKSSENLRIEKRQLQASIVIAADGAQSATRKLAAIQESYEDYGQAAIIANIQMQLPHQSLAIERFTKNGPVALLPLDNKMSLVWSVPTDQLSQFLAFEETEFVQQLQAIVGQRMGRIERVGERVGYPLKLMKTESLFKGRVLLVGNASHGIHPIAGQGFNLGLRDVAWLTELLLEVPQQLGSQCNHLSEPQCIDQFMQNYVSKRHKDIERTIGFTDSLARLFSNENSLLSQTRNLGLAALSFMPMIEHWISDTAMGLTPPVPRLACGESLDELIEQSLHYANRQ